MSDLQFYIFKNRKGLYYNRGGGLGFGTPEGLYEKLESKKNLIDIVTKIIYQSSVGHAQVNFLQFEYGCFAPNVPAIMRGKIPTEENRGKITMDISRFIIERSEIRNKQHDFKYVHFECRMVLFYTIWEKSRLSVENKIFYYTYYIL